MKPLRKFARTLLPLVIVFTLALNFFAFSPAFAESETKCAGVDTALIKCGDEENGIYHILGVVLNIMTIGVGVAGVLGIVISGIQYMTASGNEAQMIKAKRRIIEVIVGLVAWGLMWAFLQWLIPGDLIRDDTGITPETSQESEETPDAP